jgi:hypothetical protein
MALGFRSRVMNPVDILTELSIKVYDPPLSSIRESGAIADVSNPIALLMLLIDFDTEISMNGITNFIGNSTGIYARETVLALERIGCSEEAKKLAAILVAAERVGMTYEAIQADRAPVKPYTVTSFKELHGAKWFDALAEIEAIYDSLDMSHVFARAEEFIAQHRSTFEKALGLANQA